MKTVAAAALALSLPGIAATFARAQETHPFSVHDMLAMERISDPQVSPDGTLVAFTVRTTDMEANRGRTDVWIAPVDGSGEARRMTTDPEGDWNARWMPDGRSLVFLSSRGGSAQVWRLPLEGGEARRLTELPLDVGGMELFPGGDRLLLAIEVHPQAETLEESAKLDAERAADPVEARIFEELLVRHWDTLEDHRRSHLFAWTIGGGEPVDLMAGLDLDCPTRPFGGMEQTAISPDGSTVVYAARDAGRAAAWSTDLDLYAVASDGSGEGRNLTEENEALDDRPAFSPDGATLAYVAMERPGYESDRQRIVLMDWESGAKRVLTQAWDRSAGEIIWAPDGRRIWTDADHVGNHAIFAVEVEGADGDPQRDGQVGLMVEKGFNSSPRPAGNRLVYLHDDLRSPAELYATQHPAAEPVAITRLNAERVAAARMGDYEPFSFPGAGGDTVYGYLVKPADFREGRRYPVAFLIHGGPQGSFGDHFHYRWNPEIYAGAGYAALMIDFHGSTGYGQAFTDSIREDWGGKPYEDLMSGLDHALATWPFLDGSRVAALGASYGGYMINWIAGQTDRFRCLVNHDGVFDQRSMYFETEELWFPEWEHGGAPWEVPQAYELHNPVAHVERWQTPMLVIHGAQDFRVPETQGLAAFTALQRQGIPSKLLYFPDENHWVQKPANSVLWQETVLDWLQRWTGESAAPREAGSER